MVAPVCFEMLDGRTLAVHCAGDWLVRHGMPSVDEAARRLADQPAPTRVTIQAPDLGRWDASLVSYVAGLEALCRTRKLVFDKAELPLGVQRLVDLALAVPEKAGTRRAEAGKPLLVSVGEAALGAWKGFENTITFIGEATLSFVRLLVRRPSATPPPRRW